MMYVDINSAQATPTRYTCTHNFYEAVKQLGTSVGVTHTMAPVCGVDSQ